MSEIKKQWYVIRAVGGKENKVKEYIESEIRHNHLEDYISQILIPTEKVYTIRNGKKISKEKVSYPGYVLIEAAFVGQIPIIIRNTPNVLGFLGDTKEESRKMIATPLRPQEVSRILGRVDELSEMEEENEVPFFVGETVKVTDGPFSSFQGTIEAVDNERKKLTVSVKIFGRKTPMELSFTQVAKEVAAFIKLQIKGGAANPSPPVGPALGSKGVNIMDFCKQFNARTQDKAGKVLPVIITVYSDKSFDFVVKQPPVAIQLKEAAKVKSGSAQPNRDKVGEVTWEQIEAIARDKMPDLNCFTVEAAMRMVAGTARSMGINVKGEFPKK